MLILRSSYQKCSVKKIVLKIFAKVTGKHMCWSLFNKFAVLQACNFIKQRPQHRCFPVRFAKFLRTPILKNICKRLLLGTRKHKEASVPRCSSK